MAIWTARAAWYPSIAPSTTAVVGSGDDDKGVDGAGAAGPSELPAQPDRNTITAATGHDPRPVPTPPTDGARRPVARCGVDHDPALPWSSTT